MMQLHGWLLWLGWGVLGFVQFASGRYLRGYAWCYMWLHAINGSLIGIITVAFSVLGFQYYEWEMRGGSHTLLGIAVLLLTLVIVAMGFVQKLLMNKLRWKTPQILSMKLAHKVSGYILLVVS